MISTFPNLFITHDLATVKAIAGEIVVMYQGRIVEQGPRLRGEAPTADTLKQR